MSRFLQNSSPGLPRITPILALPLGPPILSFCPPSQRHSSPQPSSSLCRSACPSSSGICRSRRLYRSHRVDLLAELLIFLMAPPSGKPFIGVDYGVVGKAGATNLGDISQVPKAVKLLTDRGVMNVKIYDVNEVVLKAFKTSEKNFKLSVAVPNQEVVAIAEDQHFSDAWVTKHIVGYKDIITSIGMGNEWLNDKGHPPGKLVPAMKNLHKSLEKGGLDGKIKVSTPHAFDVEGFPPSKGKFKDEAVMKDLLTFLKRTNSFFMLNVYPFFPYAEDSNIGADYALFTANKPVVHDEGSGENYKNMFDAMVDTAISAMKRVGFPDMKIVITETGWPNRGSTRRGVDIKHAQMYNQNVIKHVEENKGTPLMLKKGQSLAGTYIFALFNENDKRGGQGDEEKHFGHYDPSTMKPVYDLVIPK